MLSDTELGELAPFSLNADAKRASLSRRLRELTDLHYRHCAPYRRILDGLRFDNSVDNPVEAFPFLPVRLFKEYELMSVDPQQVVKTMRSSGTTGQNVSKIFLDKANAANQVKALAKIASWFLGPKRLPMLVIDARATVANKQSFSARAAGILGFSMLGRDVTYALDDDMQLDLQTVANFIERHRGEPLLLFGFTSIVWQHLVEPLQRSDRRLDLSNAIMVHGGGWKKLTDRAVSNETFKQTVRQVTGLKRVHDYYGMVEQTGSVCFEGSCGRLHCSVYSDIVIRRPDFSVCSVGETGLVELVSVLPTSYPGHVLLTEDLGELLGEDDCSCGLLGKSFRIHGRAPSAEMRGCSDTYQAPA